MTLQLLSVAQGKMLFFIKCRRENIYTLTFKVVLLTNTSEAHSNDISIVLESRGEKAKHFPCPAHFSRMFLCPNGHTVKSNGNPVE